MTDDRKFNVGDRVHYADDPATVGVVYAVEVHGDVRSYMVTWAGAPRPTRHDESALVSVEAAP